MSRVFAFIGIFARTIRAIIGVPDYERYVEHCHTNHPDAPPMTRDQFAIDLLELRYSRPGTRCC